MIDFNTYKQLHSESNKLKTTDPSPASTDRKEMEAKVMESDDPPQGPELFVFPSTIVGFNLRLKKWRKNDTKSSFINKPID